MRLDLLPNCACEPSLAPIRPSGNGFRSLSESRRTQDRGQENGKLDLRHVSNWWFLFFKLAESGQSERISQWPPKEYLHDLLIVALVDHEHAEKGQIGASMLLGTGPRKKSQEACLARDDRSAIFQPSRRPNNTAVASGVTRRIPTPQPFLAQQVRLKKLRRRPLWFPLSRHRPHHHLARPRMKSTKSDAC